MIVQIFFTIKTYMEEEMVSEIDNEFHIVGPW